MLEFFAAVGLWSLIWLGVGIILLFVASAKESGFGGIAAIAIFSFLFVWSSKVDVMYGIREYPGWFIVGLVAYLPVGLAWAIFKWKMFNKRQRGEYLEASQEFIQGLKEGLAKFGANALHRGADRRIMDALSEGGVTFGDQASGSHPSDPEKYQAFLTQWKKDLDENRIPDSFAEMWKTLVSRNGYIPAFKRYKDAIASWILFWPISVILYFIQDMLVDFGRFIKRVFGQMFANMTAKEFKDIDPRFTADATKAD